MKEEKVKELNRLVNLAHKALETAKKFADAEGLEFVFDPAYGMGGYYVGANSEDWHAGDEYQPRNPGKGYWVPSSSGC